MAERLSSPDRIEPFLAQLRGLPFVESVRFEGLPPRGHQNATPHLEITDRAKRPHEFDVQLRTSYFDRASVNAVVANARLLERGTGLPSLPILIMARYVPRPTGEHFVEAGVNFLDLAGNMHLALGPNYERTVLGRLESVKTQEHRRVTAAEIQMLFLFASQPESVWWPVRDLAPRAGVSKSKAADVRNALVQAGVIERGQPDYQFQMSAATEELLVTGYSQVLRPKLMVGRFRSPERDISDFLKKLPTALEGSAPVFAVTGGPAAELLQHFYRGPELPLFLRDGGPAIQRQLRLLPDRQGPIVLLRAFGDVVFGQEVSSIWLARPWLIYAELLNAEDPRAHEAAVEFRREFLPK